MLPKHVLTLCTANVWNGRGSSRSQLEDLLFGSSRSQLEEEALRCGNGGGAAGTGSQWSLWNRQTNTQTNEDEPWTNEGPDFVAVQEAPGPGVHPLTFRSTKSSNRLVCQKRRDPSQTSARSSEVSLVPSRTGAENLAVVAYNNNVLKWGGIFPDRHCGSSLRFAQIVDVSHRTAVDLGEKNALTLRIANVHLCGGNWDDLVFQPGSRASFMKALLKRYDVDVVMGDFQAHSAERELFSANIVQYFREVLWPQRVPLAAAAGVEYHADLAAFLEWRFEPFAVLKAAGFMAIGEQKPTSVNNVGSDMIWYRRDRVGQSSKKRSKSRHPARRGGSARKSRPSLLHKWSRRLTVVKSRTFVEALHQTSILGGRMSDHAPVCASFGVEEV